MRGAVSDNAAADVGALFLGIGSKVDVRNSVFDGDEATVADSAYVGFAAQLRLDVKCQSGDASCYTVRPCTPATSEQLFPCIHGAHPHTPAHTPAAPQRSCAH